MGQYDIALRHVAQRYARDLVHGLSPAFQVESASWVETQLTAMERRMDKALELRSGEHRRLMHLEVVTEPAKDLPSRMFDYASLLTLAQRATVDKREGGGKEVPPVKSVALLLSGRAKAWPPFGELRTSWPEPEPFSGHRYQIEAVYQRTVEELLSRPGAFWLVFAPLAVDATAEAMRTVLEEMRRREPEAEERAALYAAMLVVAELNTWGHNLREEIRAMMQDLDLETIMQSRTMREAFEVGERKGIEKGVEKGRRALIEEMLQSLFMRRIHRELTPAEKEVLSSRAGTLDGAGAAAVLDLPADALMTWLMGPDAE